MPIREPSELPEGGRVFSSAIDCFSLWCAKFILLSLFRFASLSLSLSFSLSLARAQGER